MISFSIFEFHSYENLGDFQDTLKDVRQVERFVRNWGDDRLISEIRDIPGFGKNKKINIQVGDQRTPYILFEGYTERQKNSQYWYIEDDIMRDKKERITTHHVKILVFESGNKVYAIVFAGIIRAKTIIKDIFTLETWGNVNPVVIEITEDLLYWMFKRFIDTPTISLSDNKRLYINSLESYMGKTRDNINAMRGAGNRISTILGTLAFLFSNEELKALRPSIQFEGEKVLVEFGLTGTFKVWPQEYRGQHFKQLTGQYKENAVIIYIFQCIIPTLIKAYQENCADNKWSPHLKKDFLIGLGSMIREEVDKMLIKIEKEIPYTNERGSFKAVEYNGFDLEIGDEEMIEV